jgi:hypothetical protein
VFESKTKKAKVMKRILFSLMLLSSFACRNVAEVNTAVTPTPEVQKTVEPKQPEKPSNDSAIIVDIPKIAGKSAKELDVILGKPKETKKISGNSEYRLYNLANEPKGLAVRFLDGRAASFNMFLSKPFGSSQEALLKGFGINVGAIPATKNVNEPLTEKYQGKFGEVKFEKVSAKKDEKGTGFVFILAEIEN